MAADELAMRATLDASGYNSGIDAMVAKTAGLNQMMGAAGVSTGRVGSMLTVATGAMGAAALGATAVGAAFYGSTKAAANWETSMTGVAKTTGLSGTELQNLSKDLLDMSTTMPIAASSLADVAKVAGSLGVPTDQIAGFTETAAQMGVAFDMNASEAATMGAQILTSFGLPMRNLQDLGNVVNTMGDSFAATEPQVLDFLNRGSFLSSTMGQSIPQVAALGTTMISTGMNADVAATGIKSLLNTALDPKNIGSFADLLGVQTSEVGNTLKEDLGGSLITVADNLAQIQDPAERFNKAMEVAGSYGAMSLMKLSGQMDNFRKAQELSNKQWKEGDSMAKTFAANSATVNSAWQELSNTMNKAGVELGNVLLPGVGQGINMMNELAKAGISAGEQIYGAFQKFEGWRQSAEAWLGERGLSPYMDSLAADAAGIEETGLRNLDMTKMISDTYADMGAMEIPKTAQETWMENLAAWSKTASKEMAPYLASGIYDGIAMAMINAQSDAMEDDTVTRKFEYAGKNIAYKISSSGQGALQQLWADNAKLWESKSREFGATLLSPQQVWMAAFKGFDVPFPEKGTAAYFRMMGDEAQAAKIEIAEALKPPAVSLWDVTDSQRNWDKWMWQNEAIAKRSGDEVMQSLYNAMNSQAMRGTDDLALTLQESMGYAMKALGDPGSVPAQILKQALADMVGAGVLGADIASMIEEKGLADQITAVYGRIANLIPEAMTKARAALKAGDVIKDLYFGSPEVKAQAESYIRDNIADVGQYYRSQFMAEAGTWVSQAKEMGMKIPQEFWGSLYRTWMDNENLQLMQGDLQNRMGYLVEQVSDVYGDWSTFVEKATLQEQIGAAEFLMGSMSSTARKAGDDMNYLAQSADSCGAALSGFGAWQERTPELFMQPYIGQFEGYLDTYETNLRRMGEAAWVAEQTGAARLGSLATYEPVAPIWAQEGPIEKTLALSLDLTQAETAMVTMDTILQEEKTITINADISGALNAINSVYAAASSGIVIPVSVEVDMSAAMGVMDIESMLTGYIRSAGWVTR